MGLIYSYIVGRVVNASRSGQLAMSDTLEHLLTRIEWNKNVQSLTESEPDKPLNNRSSDIVWSHYYTNWNWHTQLELLPSYTTQVIPLQTFPENI